MKLLFAIVLAISVAIPAQAATEASQALREARAQTHSCQDALGVDRSPVSKLVPLGRAYKAWVLSLWRTRREAFCAAARAVRRLVSARGEASLRRLVDPCLAEIIERETAGTWNPTIWNYQGSGAYGLPQALPAAKMASAGPDWRSNPLTQLSWMRRYVNKRYGSSCAALAYHNAHGFY